MPRLGDPDQRGDLYFTAAFRWRSPRSFQAGSWNARVACSSGHLSPAATGIALTITGKARHATPFDGVKATVAGSLPARHRYEGDSAACAPRNPRSGYCSGGVAQYAFTEHTWVGRLGPVSGWWSKPLVKGPTAKPAALAWFAPVRGVGHVAVVQSIQGRALTIAEQGAYGPGVIDHALIGLHGAGSGG